MKEKSNYYAFYPSYDYSLLDNIIFCTRPYFTNIPNTMIENTEKIRGEENREENREEKNFSKIFKEFRSHSPVRKVRMIVMYLITILAYFSTVHLLFFKEELLSSMVPLFVFFAFFHFAYLEIRHRGFLRIFSIFGIATSLEMLIL